MNERIKQSSALVMIFLVITLALPLSYAAEAESSGPARPGSSGETPVSGVGIATVQGTEAVVAGVASFGGNLANQFSTPQQKGYEYADIGTSYHNIANSLARYSSGGFYGPEQDIGEAIIINIADYDPKQVRQSLLEQRDATVFVQLKGTTLNSLVSESLLEGLNTIPPIANVQIVKEKLSPRVKSVTFLPPRRGQYSLNNMGHLIVTLAKLEGQNVSLPNNEIVVDLDAKIYLDLESNSLFGVGRTDLALQTEQEEAFLNKASKTDNAFFSGRGYLRLVSVNNRQAVFEIYNRDLYPISLRSPLQTTTTGTGLSSAQTVTITEGEESQIYSLGYTGNPLQDHFRLRVDQIITPEDKALIELEFGGNKLERKVLKGKKIHSTSNWQILSVTEIENNITSAAELEAYDISPEEKRRLQISLQQLKEETYTLTLQNIITKETVALDHSVLIPKGQLDILGILDRNTVNDLELKYCPLDTKDYACVALRGFQAVYFSEPETEEGKTSLDYIIDIFDKELIDNSYCHVASHNLVQCSNFISDMSALKRFYESFKKEKTENILAERGVTTVFLYDELTSLTLKKTEKVTQKDKGNIDYRIVQQGRAAETKKEQGISAVIAEVKEGDTVKYEWRVENILPQTATLRLYNKGGTATDQTTNLVLGRVTPLTVSFPSVEALRTQNIPVEKIDIELTGVNVQNEVYVSIIPGSGRAFTTSSFKLHIPVDPRPFEWTPDKLQSQIKTTQDIIEELDKVIDRMDKIVRIWKKVCLATFAFLTIKSSFLGGFDRSIARQQVASSYKESCAAEVGAGKKFASTDACYSHYAEEMTASITDTQKEIASINDKIKGKTVNEIAAELPECSSYLKAGGTIEGCRDYILYTKLQTKYGGDTSYGQYLKKNTDAIGLAQKAQLYDQLKQDSRGLSDEEIKKAIPALERALVIEQVESREKYQFLSQDEQKALVTLPVRSIGENIEDTQLNPNIMELQRLSQYDYYIWKTQSTDADKIKGAYCNDLSGRIENNNCVTTSNTISQSDFEKKVEALKKEASKDLSRAGLPLYAPRQAFIGTGTDAVFQNNLIVTNNQECGLLGGTYLQTTKNCKMEPFISRVSENKGRLLSSDYAPSNKITAFYNPEGQPICYPIGNGEYVLVLERYDNNFVRTIRVMNVGPNGRIDCGTGDDEVVHHESYLESTAGKSLKQKYAGDVDRAQRFVCKNDGDKVGTATVNGRSVPVICDKKSIAQTQEALLKPSCYEVMDPTDCKLLFNACDPVMCPSSRCTLGGKVPPRNVIQSGIVGSTLLCLPNAKEGIVVPVCLTGIHAGLKNIRSILQGYNDCLEASLEDNKNVGICDYIRSVGICEMVWREAINLLDIGGKGLIDWASGKIFGEAKGGGEYLTFQSSFDNVGRSFDFFTNEYSNTYIAHYASRSTDELGTQICRLSVHGKFPSVGNLIDQLTEPEDPPQFTAFFDVAPYAAPGEAYFEEGVPLGTRDLSLYKVFYHIYAGTGYSAQGYTQPQSLISGQPLGTELPITYSVYLVNKEAGLPPLYVTFAETQQFFGSQGRVEPGSYQQQTVQKLGATGYNQICVNINGQESCGFGKVSSSFGLQELNDALTADEAARQEIDSAEECVPNTPTLSPSISKAATLGATGSLPTPEQYGLLSTGISRLCSFELPTPDAARWRQVGTCGTDENGKSLGFCWLDTKSFSIQDAGIANDLANELKETELTLKDPYVLNNAQSQNILTLLNGRRDVIFEELAKILGDIYTQKKHLASYVEVNQDQYLCQQEFGIDYECIAGRNKGSLESQGYTCQEVGACSGKNCCGNGSLFCCMR